MDSENTKLTLRHSKKRESKKETTQNDNIDSNGDVVKKKETRKRKKTSTIEETDSSSKRKLEKDRSKYSSDENIPKDAEESARITTKPSKRQLKREKAIQIATEKIQNSRKTAQQKALNYVTMWKHSRNEWKFEKLRQIWLMDNLLDENSIPNITFPIALEYFEGCKGMAREVLLRKVMEVIRKAENEQDEEKKNEIINSVAYVRARQLLQALPTDR